MEEFHTWYNTEHGPLRMQLGFFSVGHRYRSRDLDPPLWLAAYDVTSLSCFDDPRYITLRENRSPRELNLINDGLELLDRRIYKTLSTRGESGGPAPVIMAVTFVVEESLVDELQAWYQQVRILASMPRRQGSDRPTDVDRNQEHLEGILRIPGWQRSRCFELVKATDQREGHVEVLAIHDFDKSINGLGGPDHEPPALNPWRHKILGSVERSDIKVFDFFHSFDATDYIPPAISG